MRPFEVTLEPLCGETGSAVHSLSDGLGCDRLPPHMVSSLTHTALVSPCLQAGTPSAEPCGIPHCLSLGHCCNINTHTHTHPRAHTHCSQASFEPLGPRQEKPCSYPPTPNSSFSSSLIFFSCLCLSYLAELFSPFRPFPILSGYNHGRQCISFGCYAIDQNKVVHKRPTGRTLFVEKNQLWTHSAHNENTGSIMLWGPFLQPRKRS